MLLSMNCVNCGACCAEARPATAIMKAITSRRTRERYSFLRMLGLYYFHGALPFPNDTLYPHLHRVEVGAGWHFRASLTAAIPQDALVVVATRLIYLVAPAVDDEH